MQTVESSDTWVADHCLRPAKPLTSLGCECDIFWRCSLPITQRNWGDGQLGEIWMSFKTLVSYISIVLLILSNNLF